MEEYRDGTFGEVELSQDIFKKLREEPNENLKAIHFGSVEELEKIKVEKHKENKFMREMEIVQKKLHSLELRVNKISINFGLDNKHEILVVGDENNG